MLPARFRTFAIEDMETAAAAPAEAAPTAGPQRISQRIVLHHIKASAACCRGGDNRRRRSRYVVKLAWPELCIL